MFSTWRRKVEGEEAERSFGRWKKTLGTESSTISRKLSCKWTLPSSGFIFMIIPSKVTVEMMTVMQWRRQGYIAMFLAAWKLRVWFIYFPQ